MKTIRITAAAVSEITLSGCFGNRIAYKKLGGYGYDNRRGLLP